MRLRLAVLIVLAALTLGYRGAAIYLRYVSPDMQSRVHFAAQVADDGRGMVIASVEPEAPAYEDVDGHPQLPQPGDRILEIFDLRGQGGRVESLFDYGGLLRRVGSENPWTLVVDRPHEDGTSHMVVISVPPGAAIERTPLQWFISLGYDVYLPLIALAAGLFIGLLRPQDNRAFLAALVFIGFSAVFRQSVAQFHAAWREIALFMRTTAIFLSPVVVLQFFLLFPTRSLIDRKIPFLRHVTLAISVVAWLSGLVIEFALHHSFAAFSTTMGWLSSIGLSYGRLYGAWAIFAGVLVLIALASLVLSIFAAETAADRRRMGILAFGTFAGFIPLGAVLLMGMDQDSTPSWLMAGSIPLVGLFPLSFVYAVVRHRVFGIRLILRRGLQYALVSRGFLVFEGVVIFALIYFAALPLLGQLVSDRSGALAWSGAAIVTIGLLAGVKRVNARVLPAIDRRFFRDAYSREKVLTQLSHAMRDFASTPDRLLRKVMAEMAEAFHPSQVAIFLASGTWPGLEPLSGPRATAWTSKISGEGLDERFYLHLHYEAPPSPMPSMLEHDYGTPVLSSRISLARHLGLASRHSPESLDVFPVDRLIADDGAPGPGRVLAGDFVEDQSLFESFDTRLVLPMITAGRVLGFILLGEKLSQEPYSRADKELLMTVAEQASIALDYSRLIDRVAEQERMRRELQIARDVQAKLFPQDLPRMSTLEYSGVCRTAREVGGDYYDFLKLDEDRLGIALGDIAGKGISASLLMASLQALLRSHSLTLSSSPKRLVAELNHHLCQTTEDSRYATFFFGTYDNRHRVLRFVNAGHTPPMLLRPGGNDSPPDVRYLQPGGTVLGMFPGETYREESVELRPGDTLMVFSDGVTEAMRPDGEMYGQDRIIGLVRANPSISAEDLMTTILADVEAFVGPVEQQDDMTMIAARVA